jgi:hypothetical protein
MAMSEPDRNSTHLAGEYFVAAELYRRGYSVAMTLGNAKAIDLFAERGERTVNVQVKAIRNRKSIGWPIMRDAIKDNIVYVFICVNDPGQPPEYFVCTSAEARDRTKQYQTRGIVDLSRVNDAQYRERWDKIDDALAPVTSIARKSRRKNRNDGTTVV